MDQSAIDTIRIWIREKQRVIDQWHEMADRHPGLSGEKIAGYAGMCEQRGRIGAWTDVLTLIFGVEADSDSKPPDSFWREVPCGHPPDPVAWLYRGRYMCHCGCYVDPTRYPSNTLSDRGPVVPCNKCGCSVLCEEQERIEQVQQSEKP